MNYGGSGVDSETHVMKMKGASTEGAARLETIGIPERPSSRCNSCQSPPFKDANDNREINKNN